MAVDKLVDSTQLDSDLTDVADEIRTAGGTLLPLSFPDDYVVAIGDIGNTEIKTASGSIAHFEDALARKAQDLTVAIEPVQDLHGQANPWPAGGGKNLLTALPSPGTTVWFCEPNGFTFKANQTYCFSIGDNVIVGSYSIYAADKKTQLAYALSSKKVTYTPTVDTVGYPRLYAGEGVSQEAINSAQLELGDSRTAFAPYSNICPISGWTGANIHVSPTTDAQGGTTYSINFPSSAGTVYGGTLDVTNGKLTVDRAMVDMGTLSWVYYPNNLRFGVKINGARHSGTGAGFDGACSIYVVSPTSYTVMADKSVVIGCNFLGNNDAAMIVRDSTYTDADAFKTAVSGQKLVYPIATPIVYDLTPTEVTTLLGTNNVWADTGDSTIKYIAPKAQIPSAQGVYF